MGASRPYEVGNLSSLDSSDSSWSSIGPASAFHRSREPSKPLQTLPKTRLEAIATKATRYCTGKPCKRGHFGPRSTANKRCVQCQLDALRLRNATPEAKAKRAAYDRDRWVNDNDRMVAKNRRYYAENADAVNAQKRGYWHENRDRMSVAHSDWVAENREVVRESNASRKRLIRQATPKWVDRRAIRAVYAEARRLELETGLPHHVDHVIPIQGKTVCGLHVPWNLRPLHAPLNIGKKNKLLPELIGS